MGVSATRCCSQLSSFPRCILNAVVSIILQVSYLYPDPQQKESAHSQIRPRPGLDFDQSLSVRIPTIKDPCSRALTTSTIPSCSPRHFRAGLHANQSLIAHHPTMPKSLYTHQFHHLDTSSFDLTHPSPSLSTPTPKPTSPIRPTLNTSYSRKLSNYPINILSGTIN